MRKYIVKRLLLLIPVLFGVSLIIFLVTHAFTADPASAILGGHASSAAIEDLDRRLGFDRPLYAQYLSYMGRLFTGDLGRSLYTHASVTGEILRRFPATAELALSAIVFASALGVSIGVVSAAKKNTAVDYTGMAAALLGVSMPIFWLAIMLILLFSVTLGWLPVSGRIDIGMAPRDITGFFLLDSLLTGNFAAFANALSHLVLPTVALGSYSMAVIARMTRAAMLETLDQDYIRTARAKGLTERAVVLRHALRNALIPVVTVIGLQLGSLLAGAVLTETVFAWPGIGKYTVDAVTRSDYPVVQGVVLLVAAVFAVVNLAVDILYAFIDPRVRYS